MKRNLSSKFFNKTAVSRSSVYAIFTSTVAINLAMSPTLAFTSDTSDGLEHSQAKQRLAQAQRRLAQTPTPNPSATAFTEQAAVRPKEWKFQNEQEWIVDTTGHDVAEMLGYAKYGKSESKFAAKDLDFKTKTVDLGANSYSFTYAYKGEAPAEYKFSLQDYAWSPKNYEPLAKQLIEKFKLAATAPSVMPDDFMKNMGQADFDSLFKENIRISEALSKDPLDPSLHEQAAMLQAVFNMLEICGLFSDTRAPLSRMSAHLSLAKALNNDKLGSVGQIANIALESMSCRDGVAMPMVEEALKQQFSPEEKSILRALKIRGTGNWRIYVEAEATPLEDNQYGLRFTQTRGIEETMNKLVRKHGSLPIQWFRILDSGPKSVQTGHVIQAGIVSAELRDFLKSYNKYKGTNRDDVQNLIPELNLSSTRCFIADSGAQPLTVLSWDDVAAFHSRHIANALSSEYLFNARMYGVEQLAKQTADRAKSLFGKMNIFPLVNARFNLEEAERDKMLTDFQNLLVAHPELVTSYNWTTIAGNVARTAPQSSVLQPELWFDPPMPMGTVFYYCPRLKNNKTDVATLTELKRLSPYMPMICLAWVEKKYGEHPTSDQYREAFGPLVEFDIHAMKYVVGGEVKNPDKYIALSEKLCAEDPTEYSILAAYCVMNKRPEQAAKYFEKMVAEDEDAVSVANNSDWLIRYRYDHGQKDKARELAQFAAEVYSHRGLHAQARLFEREGNLKAAEENYRKISARYNDDWVLAAFMLRNASKNATYATEGEKLASKVFPTGMKKVKLADFKQKPTQGLKITDDKQAMQDPSLKNNAVVVAVNGYAVENKKQAQLAADISTSPIVTYIVWDGSAFKEAKEETVNNNEIGFHYEAMSSALTLDAANQKKAVQSLTDLKDRMMKQAADLQKQNLPPEEMLKRLFQQNNIPQSMYQNLLQQKAGQSAAGGGAPAKKP
ncbi:MAG TPA: hypothetical protein EYN91_22225 [Candidatus Melainabacteria bacterium]|nr:hypothetical protein [Candidatus Melainabacteria bacterium]